MSNDAILGPVILEAKVHMVHPETGNTATATYSLPPGQPVDAGAIERALRACSDAVAEHGYRLMGPNTFFNRVLVKENTGSVGNFALPRSFDYDAFGMEVAEVEREDFYDEDDFDEED